MSWYMYSFMLIIIAESYTLNLTPGPSSRSVNKTTPTPLVQIFICQEQGVWRQVFLFYTLRTGSGYCDSCGIIHFTWWQSNWFLRFWDKILSVTLYFIYNFVFYIHIINWKPLSCYTGLRNFLKSIIVTDNCLFQGWICL